MAKARFVPKPNAFYELRRSPGVRSMVDSTAASLAARAGDGFQWSSQQGERRPQGRWRAIVYPATFSARAKNRRDNTLVRVLGGGA